MALRRTALPFLLLSFLALVLGLWAGLIRVGWPWPALSATMIADHGPLMVSGFAGTLIALERAVAIGRRWGYLSPLLTALGALSLVLDVPTAVGAAIVTAGSVVLAALFAIILSRQPQPAVAVMFGGAMAWVLGNALWVLGWPIFRAVVWWAAFLVLVIAGERLELSRVRPLSRRALVAFLVSGDLVLFGAALSTAVLLTAGRWNGVDVGQLTAGLGIAALAAWLLRFDVARLQVRQEGQGRFIASCLLPGYVWLGLGGLLLAVFAFGDRGLLYDAMLHAIFLGFVISMIFAHAPIIFPAVLGAPLPFRPWFYSHLGLLQIGLVLRIVGDLVTSQPAREWGALLNAAALAWFLVNTGVAVALGHRESAAAAP